MKFLKNIGVILTLAVFVVASGCKKKSDPDPTQKILLGKLAKTWTVSSVTLDDQPRTDFSDIELVISGTFNGSSPEGPYDYDVTGTRPNPSPWPASGTWTFSEDAPESVIIRDSGVNELEMTYSLSSDASELTLIFSVTGEGWAGSRVGEVEGQWEFVFEAN